MHDEDGGRVTVLEPVDPLDRLVTVRDLEAIVEREVMERRLRELRLESELVTRPKEVAREESAPVEEGEAPKPRPPVVDLGSDSSLVGDFFVEYRFPRKRVDHPAVETVHLVAGDPDRPRDVTTILGGVRVYAGDPEPEGVPFGCTYGTDS